ncbi:hypothetical protein HN018_07940 [Lichenicola cladoniae]|uniref:Uncharacterized protein n=1 Tax=Lichenicola cladoniae TaxID=1484109 RepID=A0A6M8HNT4_9PROT|nr:hypothetical protein [Lichenicola cladoniae]NPD67488.1 hypothetical protein [Acetobacteraceae bacterium]QKE89986.1 hypothetical protein HN018_07940 [Lichenicola cladoniae]
MRNTLLNAIGRGRHPAEVSRPKSGGRSLAAEVWASQRPTLKDRERSPRVNARMRRMPRALRMEAGRSSSGIEIRTRRNGTSAGDGCSDTAAVRR